MLRRTSFLPISMFFKQLELSNPLTVKDKPVNSWGDEFLKPPVSKEMQDKHGFYAKYSDPALCTVEGVNPKGDASGTGSASVNKGKDLSGKDSPVIEGEVVLNTYYPDNLTHHGRIEASASLSSLKDFHGSLWDEKFFRKNILKPKLPVSNIDKPRVLDYMLNSVLLGFSLYLLRYALLPVWYIGQPRMTMVGLMNVEAEIGKMEDKQCKTIVWRGKPIFVYKRSKKQLKELDETKMSVLKHPETDQQRFKDNRDYAVVIAICTHLGCIPIPNEGLWGGFFCSCHASHFDASGRIRQGPAPLNLEIPPYKWLDDETIFLGKV